MKHFKKLLGEKKSKKRIEQKETETGDEKINRKIESWEVEYAMKELGKNKAAGEDEIVLEFITAMSWIWLGKFTSIIQKI